MLSNRKWNICSAWIPFQNRITIVTGDRAKSTAASCESSGCISPGRKQDQQRMSFCHHQYCLQVKCLPTQHGKELSPCHGTQEQGFFPQRPFCGGQEASHYFWSRYSSKVQNIQSWKWINSGRLTKKKRGNTTFETGVVGCWSVEALINGLFLAQPEREKNSGSTAVAQLFASLHFWLSCNSKE